MKLDLMFLNDAQLRALGGHDIRAAIEDVREVLTLHVQHQVNSPSKVVLRWGTTVEDENRYGRCNAMPCCVGGSINMAGIKWLGSNPQNFKHGLPRATGLVILNDPDTKIPLCVADCTKVSGVRTGAASALAIDKLARKDASSILLMGAGFQARLQLEAAKIVRPSLKKCFVYDIRPEQSAKYAEEMSQKLNMEVIAVDDPKQASLKSDIVITVTISAVPVVFGDWLHPGQTCLNLADFEYEYACLPQCSKVVVDDWEGVKHRQISTVSLMYRDGLFKDEQLHAELGEILLGNKPGRENDEEIIYFNSVGLGAEDLAVVTRCYRKALKEGGGTVVPYWE